VLLAFCFVLRATRVRPDYYVFLGRDLDSLKNCIGNRGPFISTVAILAQGTTM